MDYGYALAPTKKNAPSSPSKQGGKWLFSKKSAGSESPPSPELKDKRLVDGCPVQIHPSLLNRKKGFKISSPKKTLAKRKEKKLEKEQEALSDLGSSHHTRGSEFDMLAGLPPWENPSLMAEERSTPPPNLNHNPALRRSAILSVVHKKQDEISLEKGSTSSRSVLSNRSVGIRKVQCNQMSLESLTHDCESSNSSISLEDIGCIHFDESFNETQSFSLRPDKSSVHGTGSRQTNIPPLQRTISGSSATSSKLPSIPRRCRSSSVTLASSSVGKLPPPATGIQQDTMTSPMNASMDLGDVFNDSASKISIEGNVGYADCSKHDKGHRDHNDSTDQKEELSEKEMLKVVMERSVHDFSGAISTPGGLGSRGCGAYPLGAASFWRPATLPQPPSLTSHMKKDNKDMLGNHLVELGGDRRFSGCKSSGEEDDIDVQERNMLEVALQRSVRDVGGCSSAIERTGRPAHRSVTRHKSMAVSRHNMSMDLTAVFEEENSEPMSSYRVENCVPMVSEQIIGHNKSGFRYNEDHQAGSQHKHGHSGFQRSQQAESVPAWSPDDDSGMLAQQEAEMIRLAMERSMQDFSPPTSPRRQAPVSPRRSSDCELSSRNASMSMMLPRHTRSFSTNHDTGYTYSHVPRNRNDPPSPQRSSSASVDAGRRHRELRSGRRYQQHLPEPPSFYSHTHGELSSVKEQEQEMLDQALALSRQDYSRHSRYN